MRSTLKNSPYEPVILLCVSVERRFTVISAAFFKLLSLTPEAVPLTLDHYEVKGLKYVPVKVKTSDYEDFKSKSRSELFQ